MTLLVTMTLIAVGLIIVALALSLITILWLLRSTLSTLGTINVGLRSIAHRVEPLEPVLGSINSDLARARNSLVSTLQKHRPPTNSKTNVQELV